MGMWIACPGPKENQRQSNWDQCVSNCCREFRSKYCWLVECLNMTVLAFLGVNVQPGIC